jgi:putative aldouronate transport system permease protein
MAIKRASSERIFAYFNTIILIFVSFLTLFPFLHIVAKSFSAEAYVLAKDVVLWPVGFTTSSYSYVLGNPRFIRAFGVSVYVTTVGTALNMLLTTITAYPLSKKRMPGKSIIMFMYVFTMMFNGGLIPTYLLVRNLGLINRLWALILPAAVIPFNMIILKNFFMSIPDSLEESAVIDGATQLRILFTIIVPLSLPAMATVGLFYAVGHWNQYFNALIYLSDRALYPLQLYLREIIIEDGAQLVDAEALMDVAPISVRGATIVAATVPILLVYPFVQKYFVKGIMIGAVKG